MSEPSWRPVHIYMQARALPVIAWCIYVYIYASLTFAGRSKHRLPQNRDLGLGMSHTRCKVSALPSSEEKTLGGEALDSPLTPPDAVHANDSCVQCERAPPPLVLMVRIS